MKKLLSKTISGAGNIIGRRLTSLGRRLTGESDTPTWEDRAVRDSRNIIRLVAEVTRERNTAIEYDDSRAVAEFDEALGYMQHSVTRLLGDILRNPEHRLFTEALDCMLNVTEAVGRAQDLDGYAGRLRERIGPVEWTVVRASAFAEVAEGMKLGSLGTRPRPAVVPRQESPKRTPAVQKTAPVVQKPQQEQAAPQRKNPPGERTIEELRNVEELVPDQETDPVQEVARAEARKAAQAGASRVSTFGPFIY